MRKQLEQTQTQTAGSGASASKRVPKATTVWAKTSDLGIVERTTGTALVKENISPEAPAREFPKEEHAVLIEGFVFPSNKAKLAKKVEKKLQEQEHEDEIIVSDSDESDVESCASSASSWDISDVEENEFFSSDELPLFANLWRMFSSWITHETTLLAAGLPLPVPETKEEEGEEEKEKADAAVLAARKVKAERLEAFTAMLNRTMPDVTSAMGLPCDRYLSKKIYEIVRSFNMKEAIDGRNSQVVSDLMMITTRFESSCFSDSECVSGV